MIPIQHTSSGEILIRIRKMIRALHLESKKVQREHGVSIPQALCLNFLNLAPGHQATHKEIAGYLQLSSSTLTGIINRLEDRALLARLPKQGDRRTTVIILTSKGKKLLGEMPPLLQDQLTTQLREYRKEDLDQIIASLDQLIRLLGIEGIDASPVLSPDPELDKTW